MRACCGILLLVLSLLLFACQQPGPVSAGGVDTPAPLARWQSWRFGLFVHWGPVSLKGTEIGWSRGGERRGRKGKGHIPVEVYDNLYKRFNPVKFDAAQWVGLAKAAGMRYLVFTTKHHDGFCMFDSALTDYKITNTPFRRDVVGELAQACHQGGLGLGFYYSQPDWRHPDYRTRRHPAYIDYLHGQVRELCTKYGKVDTVWFDGLRGKSADWDAPRLLATIKKLQPGVLINNRAGLPADYDTPEQRIGHFQNRRPWESCITICRQWAWKPNDKLKSLAECITTLARCAGGDGNLLLNVGPMPDGSIEPRQAERLREIGAWLSKYGESIYATRGGPYKPWSGGACTHRGNGIYLHVFDWGEGEAFTLPPLPAKVVGARLLAGPTVRFSQDERGLTLTMGREYRHPIDTVVVLRLDRPAAGIAPLRAVAPSGSLASGCVVKASNTWHRRAYYGPDKAVDDDPTTRWATDAKIKEAWLEIDLGRERTICRAVIAQEYDRVRSFTIERKGNGTWNTLCKGGRIGARLTVKFTPCSARHVRLRLQADKGGPTIKEFRLF